jgi:hypothetical protein
MGKAMATTGGMREGGAGIAFPSASPGRRPGEHRRRPTKVDRLEDLLPEHVQYRDLGCEVSATCLNCPLPVCRYEVPGGLAALQRGPRDAELLALHRGGASIEYLCREFGLSRRSVFRILAAARRLHQGNP